jgi:cytoskeleton protein RodZ
MQKDLRDTPSTSSGMNSAAGQTSVHKDAVDKLTGEFILTNPAAEPLQPTCVGELLQAARIQAGLSIADVANRLRMGAKQVDALERADYAALPAGTFLRGFVRNYAKAVGVSVDEALATLERTHKNAAALAASIVVAPTIAASPINLHGSSQVLASPKARLLVALVVVLLLAAAAWYWWANVRPYLADGGRAKPADTSVVGAPANEYTLPQAPASTDAPTATINDQVSQPNLTPLAAVAANAASSVTPAGATPTDTLKKSDPNQASAAAVNVAIAEPTPPILAASRVISTPITSEPTKPSRAIGETGRIGFTFSGQSWVEITDSTGRTILSRRYNAGETDEVGGRGPFSIVVGNATVTRMAYNGREFDLAPHRRGNSTVARVNVN